jgi:hypothetical protein
MILPRLSPSDRQPDARSATLLRMIAAGPEGAEAIIAKVK